MKIKQMVAANPGWFVQYAETPEIGSERIKLAPEYPRFRSPIVAWVLVEDSDGHSEVRPVTANADGLDHDPQSAENFDGIVYESNTR